MTEIPIVCTLNKDALNQRQDELKTLQRLVREIRPMPRGFALRFDGSTENFLAIAQAIAQERLCCPFLQFQLIAEPGTGPLWLEVSGPNETAQFLLAMFGFGAEGCDSSCISSQC
ncbi:MAG: hypothetical protein ACRDEA_16900 [Microcystaceae cyanobacterium]